MIKFSLDFIDSKNKGLEYLIKKKKKVLIRVMV